MREVLYQLISSHYTELLALWPMALLVIGLYIAVFIDPYIEKRERRIMLTVCTLVFSLVVENYLDYLLSVKITAVLFRKIVDIYGYSIRPVILLPLPPNWRSLPVKEDVSSARTASEDCWLRSLPPDC